jgi:hypothetical protein
MAADAGSQIPGARLVSSIKTAEVGSPVSWFFPATTRLNYATPDPLMSGRFYLISMSYEEREPSVHLIDVFCDDREGIWYDLDQPATAPPARSVFGEAVVAPNGQTWRRMKVSSKLPAEWLHAFCDTDWTAERKAVGTAIFKTPPG